jgi:integrase
MPRKAQGTVFVDKGAMFASVIVAPRKRLSRVLQGIASPEDEDKARAWAATLQALVDALRAAARSSEIAARVDEALEVGRSDPEQGLARVQGAVGKLKAQKTAAALVEPRRPSGGTTFRAFAQKWTSGDLHREYPDHVADVDQDKNASRLKTYVYPVIGGFTLAEITLDHCEDVLRRIPPQKSRDTRRHVAQLMVRIFNLATYPSRLLAHSPLPRGFLPKRGPRKALSYVYPEEDAKLLGCTRDVPLVNRLLYGFLCREGMRSGEALSLTWSDLDLDHGAVRLDENKTDDARAWALDAGVVRALAWWRKRVPHEAKDPVFPGISNAGHLADGFRAHLELAGVKRPELYERSKARRPVRLHDCRATFITLSLANDKTEGWVTDRTGHKSSGQVATYRRTARTAAELELGALLPLDKAIPEIRKARRRAA